MNHSDYIEKRDEILRKYGEAVDSQGYEIPELAEAAQAIDALVLEVIGKDDTDSYSKTCEYCEDWEYGRQEKLDEQRKTVQGDK